MSEIEGKCLMKAESGQVKSQLPCLWRTLEVTSKRING